MACVMPACHTSDEDCISDPPMIGRDVGGLFDFRISVGEHNRPRSKDHHEIYQLKAVIHQLRELLEALMSKHSFEPLRYTRWKCYDTKPTDVGSLRVREYARIRCKCYID